MLVWKRGYVSTSSYPALRSSYTCTSMCGHEWTRGCSRDEGGGQYLSASRARAERCDSVAFAMRGVVGLWRVAGGHMGSTRASGWGVAVQEVRRTLWRDEGLSSKLHKSCNSDFTSLARVYEDVFTRGGPTKLESYIHNIYKFQRLLNRDGVNRCAYIVGYPGAPCRARPQAHRGPGIGTRLGPLALPPPRPSGSLPLVSPRHGRALVGSDQALCTSRVHQQHPSLRPSSSTTFHLDKSSLSRRFIGD